jgi:hypothetical protein
MQPTVLAATRRDGAPHNRVPPVARRPRARWRIAGMNACSGAHFFVGGPRNIDIFLRALLLELHPTSPPSHTCLYMK